MSSTRKIEYYNERSEHFLFFDFEEKGNPSHKKPRRNSDTAHKPYADPTETEHGTFHHSPSSSSEILAFTSSFDRKYG